MGRIYTASVGAVAVTAIQDLWELVAPADAIVALHAVYVTQTSDVGDAAEEILQVQISRSTGSSGSGGSSVTPRPHESGSAAFGGTCEANNTSQATTTTTIHEDAFNIRVGWIYLPPPEQRIILSPSARLVVELPVAPSDSITVNQSIVFEAIGG